MRPTLGCCSATGGRHDQEPSWSLGLPVVCTIKRATERRTTELGEPGWWLLRNAEAGSDSHAGAVADDDVLAVVVRRIWPLLANPLCQTRGA